MIQYLQKTFALSERGARDLVKACLFAAVQDISFMLPVSLLYFFVCDALGASGGAFPAGRVAFYGAGCVVALVFIMVATVFQYNSCYFATYIESGVRRIALAERLRKIPLSFFGKKDLADLTTTLMADSTSMEKIMSHSVPALAGAVISTTLIGVSLFSFDARMAAACLWVLPISFAIMATCAKIQERVSARTHEAKVACEEGIQEFIEAIKDLKSCNAEKAYLADLSAKIDAHEKRAIAGEVTIGIIVTSATLVLKLGMATVALAGGVLLVRGELSVPVFFMFLLVASRLYDPLNTALQHLGAINGARPTVARLDEVLFQPIQTGKTELTNNGTDIVFSDVQFSYKDGTKVLDGVTFTAKQGEVTALVGTSGSGKTTVSRLVSRFWDADSGSITVGGMEVRDIDPETLMRLYSIVFQEVTLFDNTILENIRLGKNGATDEEVREAARRANVDEFASKLPDGYQTRIGENGSRLSGGERQRISIARAFLKDAPVILLDEATASLDAENETQIQQSLSRLIKGKTVLVIAHRMRTVLNADKVVVLDGGKVAESGTPAELLARGGVFAQIAAAQTAANGWTV